MPGSHRYAFWAPNSVAQGCVHLNMGDWAARLRPTVLQIASITKLSPHERNDVRRLDNIVIRNMPQFSHSKKKTEFPRT
jgi:hypothetical protein